MPPLDLKSLQSPVGLLDVLAYLVGRDVASPADAIADLGLNRKTFYACIEKLRALGFVFDRREAGYPPRAYYGLTRRGQRAAERIAGLMPLVAESAPSLEREEQDLKAGEPTKEAIARRREVLLALVERSYAEGEWDRTLGYADDLRLLASEGDDREGIALAELWAGKVLQKRSDESCLPHLDASYRTATRARRMVDVAAEALYVRGCFYERKGRYDEAEADFRRCANLAAKARSRRNRGRAALGLGRVLVERGRHAEARGPLEEARGWLEADGEVEDLPAVYGNLGASYFPDDAREALAWHERAIRACELGGHVRMLVFELLNAAGALQKLGDAKEARRRMDRARELAEDLEDAKLLASILVQSASVRSAQGDLRGAEADARRAIEAASAEGLMRELAHAHYLLGDILGKRDHKAAARDSFERARRLFQRLKDEEMARRLAGELRNLKT